MSKVNPKIAAETASLSKNKDISNTSEAKSANKTKGLFEADKTEETAACYILGEKTGTAPTIDKDTAKEYAEKLYEAMKGIGANGKAVDEIILDENLNSFDIVSIMGAYGSVGGCFLEKALASNFMGKHEDELLQRITDACFEVFADDNKANSYQHRVARVALTEKTLENFMIKKGIINKDTESLNISTSTMVTGTRG